MDTSSSYEYMVGGLHCHGFGAMFASARSLFLDQSKSFLEKHLLTLLRISMRTDGLRSWSTRGSQLCLLFDWLTFKATVVLFPTVTKTGSSVGGQRNRESCSD